jgi:anaerobic ribonucleoside-triphosphate reductase
MPDLTEGDDESLDCEKKGRNLKRNREALNKSSIHSKQARLIAVSFIRADLASRSEPFKFKNTLFKLKDKLFKLKDNLFNLKHKLFKVKGRLFKLNGKLL